MKRSERVAIVDAVLQREIGDVPIPLDHRDPFTLLVAVVLSAQCTDARVNLVTPALFDAAPTPAALAKMAPEQILPYIASCGLAPTKARNLAALGRQLVTLHGGQVPSDEAALEALPGVGHKTASVVRVQSFGIPAFPVDTHVARLANRWGLSKAKAVGPIEADLRKAWPAREWGRVHLQMVTAGRRFCPALRHDALRCPVCAALAEAGGGGV